MGLAPARYGALMPRHVILVGLPGSGKSTVGKLVAEALPAPLIDIDGLLVREMGMPVSQIFGMVGEAKFREMERDAVNAAQGGAPGVIVPGGGWAAQPGQLEATMPTSLVVYLKCDAVTATKRSAQGEARPMLVGGDDPGQRMRALLEEREPYYMMAHHQVDVERSQAETVAAEIVALARHHGGW
jgi:shikimate kinase